MHECSLVLTSTIVHVQQPEPREALAASTPPRAAATDEQKSPRPGRGTRKRARKAMNAVAWRAAQAKEAG